MQRFEGASFAQDLAQFKGALRILPRVAVDVDRHQHARGNVAGLEYAQNGKTADNDVLRQAGKRSGFLEQRLEILQVHTQDQGVFWKSASSHSPRQAIARASSTGGSASRADQRLT